MKKINLLAITLLLISLTSCHDETGDYTRTYYTDAQLTTAIKQCLNVSLDTANTHLSVPDGFYTHNNGEYRITLPASADALVSTLTANGHGELLDTLILRINRAAEISGNQIKINFSNSISSSSYPNPGKLLGDSLTGITLYFRQTNTLPLLSVLIAQVRANLISTHAIASWEEAVAIYGEPLSVDLIDNVTRQIIDHIMTEMALEEALIKSDTTHQTTDLMRNVFRNYPY